MRRGWLLAGVLATCLAACGEVATTSSPIVLGTEWRALGGGVPLVGGEEPTLLLGPGRLTGTTGCNEYSSQQLLIGPASSDGVRAVSIGKLIVDENPCANPGRKRIEHDFIATLAEVRQLRFDEVGLILEGPHGRIRFEPLP